MFFPDERVVAHRREHLEVGRERLEHDLESNLVVAGCRAAMGNRGGAELSCGSGKMLSLHAALGADTKRIQVAAPDVAHDQVLDDGIEEFLARIDLDMLDGAELGGFRGQRTARVVVEAAGIDRRGYHRAAVGLLQPRHTK